MIATRPKRKGKKAGDRRVRNCRPCLESLEDRTAPSTGSLDPTSVAVQAGVSTPAAFSLTNTPVAPASIKATPASAQSATVKTAFAHPLVATVTDQYGNPISGVSISFAVPASGASGTFSNKSATITGTTDAQGRVSEAFTANTTAGTYSVTASVPGVSTPAAFSLTNTPGAPASIMATSGSGQSATVHTAFAHPLVATVTDQYGNPLSGRSVTFTAPTNGPGGTFGNGQTKMTGTTDAHGQVSEPFTANTTAGTYSVTASSPGVSTPAPFSLTNTPVAPGSIMATSGSGQSVAVGTASLQQLVARFKNLLGNPVSGVSVRFAAPASGASGIFSNGLATTSGTTDANGQVSEAFTANTTAGTYSVTASVAGVDTPASFTLTNTPGAPASIMETSGSGQSATVNTAFTNPLVATVTDQYGNPVSSGVSVSFAVTPAANGASATLSSSTATTGANGQASVTATANTTAGTYSVTASVAGVDTPASFTLTNTPGAPAYIVATSGSGQSATVNSLFPDPLVATVTDQYGNPVSGGVSVSFAVTPAANGASGTFSNESATIIGTTVNGQVSEPFTANTTAGSYVVTASAAGDSTSFTLTNTPGAPASIIVATSGSGQSATVNSAFPDPLVATVTDQYGNPVSGLSVRFAAPASGVSGTFSNGSATITGTTDANGQVSEAFTANTKAGTYSVTASVAGVSTSFTLTNTPEVPAIIATSGSGQSATVNTAFTNPLVVTVTDQYGNPVSGLSVSFNAPTGFSDSCTFSNGLATITGTTDANGQV